MLVISQKKGEKLHIGRDITISILDLQSGKVRLGIEAPSAYQILRDTLYDAAPQEPQEDQALDFEHAHEPSEREHEREQNAPESNDSQADAAPYKKAKSKLNKSHAY